ncbi:MAG: SDR family NAD(P)-dependent oxidoreductase [Archangium sp.]
MSTHPAFIITGPTSGFGLQTAFELAKHGTLVLVGRDAKKLDDVKTKLEAKGHQAIRIVCDLSDLASVRRAAEEIITLRLPIAGLVNNAGIREEKPTKSAQGFDNSYATNHLGPFVFTELLAPHLPDGATVTFVCSAVEDPERKPARMAGFRGARYLSAEACARGEWKPGGSEKPGMDSYATTKQCNLATTMAFSRELPRLKFIAVEPGFSPVTGLSRDASAVQRVVAGALLSVLRPLIKHATTPALAAKLITNAVLNTEKRTGIYLDEKGSPMQGSVQVSDPKFQDLVVAETRAFLSANQGAQR